MVRLCSDERSPGENGELTWGEERSRGQSSGVLEQVSPSAREGGLGLLRSMGGGGGQRPGNVLAGGSWSVCLRAASPDFFHFPNEGE